MKRNNPIWTKCALNWENWTMQQCKISIFNGMQTGHFCAVQIIANLMEEKWIKNNNQTMRPQIITSSFSLFRHAISYITFMLIEAASNQAKGQNCIWCSTSGSIDWDTRLTNPFNALFFRWFFSSFVWA